MGRGSRRVMEERLRLAAQARQLEEKLAKEAAEVEASAKAYQAKLAAEKLAQEAIAKIKAEEEAAAEAASAEPQPTEPGDSGWKSKMNKGALASWLAAHTETEESVDALVSENTKAALVDMASAALAANPH